MLPFLNSSRGNAKKQIVQFRGINFSDRYTDGDMLNCMNLSARRSPFLTTRRARKHMPEYDGSSAFLYRDKPIWVKGTDLIYDGRVVAQVTEGEKQFALVNTKLCVFPDKIYVDVKTLEVKKLNEGVNSAVGADDIAIASNQLEDGQINSAIYTKFVSALNADPVQLTSSGSIIIGNNDSQHTKFYTYGKDYKEVEKCWDSSNSAWDMDKLAALESEVNYSTYEKGAIVILGENGYVNLEKNYGSSRMYGTISMLSSNAEYEEEEVGKGHWLYGHKYEVGGGVHKFTEVFKAGDAISVTGTRGGVYDTEKALLNGVEDSRLSFGGDVFKVSYNGYNVVDSVYAATIVRTGLKAGKYRVSPEYDGVKIKEYNLVLLFEVKNPLPGRYSFVTVDSTSPISGSPTKGNVFVFDLETRTIVEECETDWDYSEDLTSEQKKEYAARGSLLRLNVPNGDYVSFSKPYPELDFVCESENRLWGCSNKDQTIYASALGDPTNFFVYDGLSTDSFAVAVGTEGEFTGCCKHSSSVLFWKETKLHKVLGSFPAEYIMYTYEMEGLQKGSHKSMQIINDVLFFLGNHGVYAFTGGTPSLISSNFGETRLDKGVAGSDGDTYYLSAWEGDTCHLLLYETKTGQWMKEDATNAVDFARTGEDLYMLNDNGEVWLMDAKEEDADIEWMAHFTPFYESIEGRKMYTKLLLRMQMPKGAWLKAEVRCDDGMWRDSGRIIGGDADTIPLNLPINRCDKLEVRLSGYGQCTIMSMLLEYKMGSDV